MRPHAVFSEIERQRNHEEREIQLPLNFVREQKTALDFVLGDCVALMRYQSDSSKV